MKIKKLLSLALTLSMLPVAGVKTTLAANENVVTYLPTAWSKTVYSANTAWNEEQDYMKTTLDGGYKGTPGLEVNIESPVEQDRYLMMTNTLKTPLEAGSSYRVKFRYKGAGNFAVIFAWAHRANATAYKVESTDGEWKYVYKDIDVTASRAWMGILCDAKQHHIIDDVSVQKLVDGVPDGVELVNNGDFTGYSTSYKFNLETDKTYTSNSWKTDKVGMPSNSVAKAQLTANYSHSGKYSMYVKGATEAGYMIVQPRTVTKMALGNSYYIEFYAISKTNATEVTAAWNRFGAFSSFTKSAPDANGWVKYSKTISLAADSKSAPDNFWFLVDVADEFLVDDVSVQLVENGVPNGINLMADGGFEDAPKNAENKYVMNKWGAHYNDPTKAVINADTWKNTYYAEATGKESYSGDYSLHIAHPGKYADNQYVLLRQDGKSLPAGNYYLSMYVKGKSTKTHACMAMGARKNIGGTYADWTKMEFIITETAARSTFDLIAMDAVDLYVDDIELYKAEPADAAAEISLTNYKKTGENLVTDGGFEDVKPSKQGTSTKLIASPTIAAGGINISWKNPVNHDIEDINLYFDGKLIRNTVIDETKGAFNQMRVDGLTPNKEYPVKLVIRIGGEDYEYTTVAIPDSNGHYFNHGDWKTLRTEKYLNEAKKYITYPNTDVRIDYNEKASGKSSIRLDANIPEVKDNIYANVMQNSSITLRKDTKYLLKFKYKTEDVSNFSIAQDCVMGSTTGRNKVNIVNTNTTTNGWVSKEVTLAPNGFYDEADMDDTTYTSVIMFIVEQATGSVWIDDVELYAIDVMTDELDTTNLIKGGDFEVPEYKVSAPEYKLVAEDGTKTAIAAIKEGNIEVTAKVKNNAMGDNFKVALMVALYNGNKLEQISVMEKNAAVNSVGLPGEEYTASVTVPSLENNNYKVKVMCWNGTDSLAPLSVVDVLETEAAN